MFHFTGCRFVVEFLGQNLPKCTVYATFLNQFSWKDAIRKTKKKKEFYNAYSRGWHQNCLLVHVSGSRVAELEMHLLAAKVNYCTQQVADLLLTINNIFLITLIKLCFYGFPSLAAFKAYERL